MVIRALAMAVMLGCGVAVVGLARAQTANSPASQNQQKQPEAQPQQPQAAPAQAPHAGQPGSGSNPFPEDESTVPVMPTKDTPDVPAGDAGNAAGRNREDWGVLFPAGDLDPVPSPDGSAGSEGSDQGFSSSSNGVDSLLPPPGASADTGKKHGKHSDDDDDVPAVHHENAAEDESVGKYYLDNKNWHAALSRFESALVLDPDNPDVYWGLAESQRHLGQFADARANYEKVMEYDPDSRHAKDAKKALAEPEMANAKAARAK